MNKEKKIQNTKGITLIALVITIVVLVILVGVTVSTAINSGLIANSKKAVSDYEKVQGDEEQGIASVDVEMDFLQMDTETSVKYNKKYFTGATKVTDIVSLMENDKYEVWTKDGANEIEDETT